VIRRTLFVSCAFALLLAACGDDDTATTTETPLPTSATESGDGFPDAFVDGYMEGCTSEAPEAACRCTLDEFEKRYSLTEFMSFGNDPDDPRVVEVIEICLTAG